MSGRRSKKNQRLGSSRRGPKGLNRNIEKDDVDDVQQIAESGDGKNEFHTTSDNHSAQFDHQPSSSIAQQTSALECPPHARIHKDSLMETELPEGKRKMGSTRKSAGGFKVERKVDELRTTEELDEYDIKPNISATEEQHSSLRGNDQSRSSSFPSNLSLHTESSGLEGEHRATLMDVVSENKEKYAIHPEITSHSYEVVSATVSESDLLREDPVMFNKLNPLSHQETQFASTTGQKRRMGSTRRPLGGKNSENLDVQEHSRSMREDERKAEVIDKVKFSMSEEMAQMWDDVVRDAPSSHTETSLVSNQPLLAERAELKEPDVSTGTETINQSVAFPLVNPEKSLPETSSHNGTHLLNKGLDFKFGSHLEDFNVLNKVLEDDNQHVPDIRNDTNTFHDCSDVNTAEGQDEVLMQEEEPSRNKKTRSLSPRHDAQLEELVLNCEEFPSLSQHTAQLIDGGNIRFDVPASNISHAEPTATNSPHAMSDAFEESQEMYVEMKHKNNVCDVASITCNTLTDLECADEDERGSETDNGFEIIDQGDAIDHNVIQIIMESRNNKEDRGTTTETVSHQEPCEVSNEKEELHREQEYSSTISQILSGAPQDNAGEMLDNKEVREDKGETENTIIIDVTSKSEEMLSFEDSATDTGSHAHQQLFIQSPGKEGYDLCKKLENVAFDGCVGRSEETQRIEGMDASLLILEVEKPPTNVNKVYNDSESDLQTENPDQNRVLTKEQNYTSSDINQEAFQVLDNVSAVIDSSPLLHVAIGSVETDTIAEESDISLVIPEDSQDSFKLTTFHSVIQLNEGDAEIVPAGGGTDLEIQTEIKSFYSSTSEAKGTEENILDATVIVKEVEVIGDTVTVDSDMTTESDFHQNASSPDAHVEDLKVSENVENKVSGETDTNTEPSDISIIPEDSHREEVHAKSSPVVYKRKMGSTRRPLRGNKGQMKGEEYTETLSEIQGQDNVVGHNMTQDIFKIRDHEDEEIMTTKLVCMPVQLCDDLKQEHRSDVSQTQTGPSQDDTLEVPERTADIDRVSLTSHSDLVLSDALPMEETQIHVSSEDVVMGDTWVPPTEVVEMHSVSNRSLQKRKIGSTRKRGKRMVNEEEVEEEQEREAENTTVDDGTKKSEETLTLEEAITGSLVHQQAFQQSDVQTEKSEQNYQNQAAEIVSDLPLGDVETYSVPEQNEIISIIPEESHRKDVQSNSIPVVQRRKMGSSRKTVKGNKEQRREVESKKMDEESKGIAKEQDTDKHLAIREGENKWKLDEDVEQNFPVEFSYQAAISSMFFGSEDGVKEVSLNIHDPPEVSEETGLENTVNYSNSLNEATNLYEGTMDKFVLTVSHEDFHQTMSTEYLDQHVHGGSETEQTETMCHVFPTQELKNTQDDVHENSSQKIPCTKEKRRKMGSTRRNPRVMHGKEMGDQGDILGRAMERETKKAEDDLDDMPSSISQPKEMSSEAVSTTDLESEMSVSATDLKGGENDYQNNSDPSGPEPPENILQKFENQLVSPDVTIHLQPETVTVEKRRKMGSTRKNVRGGGIRGKRDAYEDMETADTHLTMSQDSEIGLVGKAVGEQTIHDQSEDSLLNEIERALNKTSQSSSNELNVNEPNSGDLVNTPYLNKPENSEIKSLQPLPTQISKTHSEPNSPERRRRKMGSTRRNPRQQLKTEREDENKEDGEVEENSEEKKQEMKNPERAEASVVHNIPENKLNKEHLNVPNAHTSSSQLEESDNPVVQERTSPSSKRKFGSRRTNKGKQGLGRLDASDRSELEDEVNDDLMVCDPYHNLQPENQPISKSISEQSNMEAKNEEAAPKGTGAGLVSLDQIIKRDRSIGTKQTINIHNRNSEVQFNVVMVGNSYVGKTSFIRRFHEGQFTEDYGSTIGVDTCMQTVVLPDRTVKLQIWDTAGQERFHSITRQVFHKADGLLLMYEITCSKSFISVRDWISQARERAPEDAIMILLGNKNDSVEREVQIQEGVDLAREYNIHFMECSAATGANVSESMMTLAELLVQRKTRKEEHTTLRREPPPKKSGCC